MIRALVRTLSPLLVVCASIPAVLADNPPKGLRVFSTTHSFHNFVGPRLAPLAKAAGISDHYLEGVQMIGGSQVKFHWDLADEKNKAKAALIAGKVDLLTMSPNMTVPDVGIERFVELGLKHNPKIRFLVQESWIPFDSPEDKVKTNDERDGRTLESVKKYNAKFKAALEKQVRELNQKQGHEIIHIVPVGDAVLKLRERIAEKNAPGLSKQSELFTDPIGHGKVPIQVLAAYCNFACIYRISPVGLKDAQPDLDKLNPDLKPLLQRLAWEAVTEHPMSGVKAK